MAATTVPKLYQSVMEEVISNVREAFIDEGVDEQALSELKQLWEKKLAESKAIERDPDPPVVTRVATTNVHPQPVQPQTTHITSASVTHQLAMPTPQAFLQYSTGTSDGQKTMALNLPQKLTLTVPAHIAQTGLQTLVSTAPGGATTVQIPPEFAHLFQGNVLHTTAQANHGQHGQQISAFQTLTAEQLQKFTVAIPVTTSQSQATSIMGQIDGAEDTSDEEEEDEYADNDDDRDDHEDEQNEEEIGDDDEVEPLNSDDDVSDDDPSDLFDTENVVVCQYDKITRSKNRWKFHLKDGIMNLQGKDFVFQKALGDSEW